MTYFFHLFLFYVRCWLNCFQVKKLNMIMLYYYIIRLFSMIENGMMLLGMTNITSIHPDLVQ